MACSNGIFEFADDWQEWLNNIDDFVEDTWVGSYFKLKERNSKLSTEVRAGAVTFITTAYILSVNTLILSDTGGTCGVSDCTGIYAGQDRCRFTGPNGYRDPGYTACLSDVKRDLITATAGVSLVASFLMGVGANLPVAAAPGMGLNAYFAYHVVGVAGSGQVSYQRALAAVFVEGCIFVLLAMTGLRLRLIRLVPRSIMLATSAGIGLFLAFIGLQNVQGLAVIAFNGYNLVALGGCAPKYQQPAYVIPDSTLDDVCVSTNGEYPNLPRASGIFQCDGHVMESAMLWLGLAGLVIMAVMMSRSFRGSVFIGMLFVTIISWIPGTAASYLGSGAPIPGGEARLDYFKKVATAPALSRIGAKLDFSGFRNGNVWIALFTFLYVDFLDTTGTLFSMASFLNNFVPGFVNPDKTFERHWIAFSVDGLASICGALMGTSPVTAFIESASGIREGGRTGLTALTVAFFFFVALWFSPLLASVPPYAVGPALITVGALMMMNSVRIKWDQAGEALPAFITMIVMPLTYSIAYGVIAGLVGYVLVNSVNYVLDRLADCLAPSQEAKVQKLQASFTHQRNGSWNGRPPSDNGNHTQGSADASMSTRAPRRSGGLRHSESRAPVMRRNSRSTNDVGEVYFHRPSRKHSLPDQEASDSPGRRRSGLATNKSGLAGLGRQRSTGSQGSDGGDQAQQGSDHASSESQGLQQAASRLQQLVDDSGMEAGIWKRKPVRSGSQNDLEHLNGSPGNASRRHSELGEDHDSEKDAPNGPTGPGPWATALKPRLSPWNWSPRVSMTQQDTIHEQDRSSDDEASTTTSSSSEDKGPQPKGLLRRSVLWGHNVGKNMLGGVSSASSMGSQVPQAAPPGYRVSVGSTGQPRSGNNSRRNFLGRVSATSFLDSVGGMIPGSSPETEQLPEARVLSQRGGRDHASRKQQRDALREQRRRWVELGELGELPGAPQKNREREEQRKALAAQVAAGQVPDSIAEHEEEEQQQEEQPHHKHRHRRKQRRSRDTERAPNAPAAASSPPIRESFEMKIARLGSLGGLFRTSVMGAKRPSEEQLPAELSGWPPAAAAAPSTQPTEQLHQELSGWPPRQPQQPAQQPAERISGWSPAQQQQQQQSQPAVQSEQLPQELSGWPPKRAPQPAQPVRPPAQMGQAPGEQLPAELSGWPPRKASQPTNGTPPLAPRRSTSQGERMPPELSGWPPPAAASQEQHVGMRRPSGPLAPLSPFEPPRGEQLPAELSGWPPRQAAARPSTPPLPALKRSSSPRTTDSGERPGVKFQEPQASEHDPDTPSTPADAQLARQQDEHPVVLRPARLGARVSLDLPQRPMQAARQLGDREQQQAALPPPAPRPARLGARITPAQAPADSQSTASGRRSPPPDRPQHHKRLADAEMSWSVELPGVEEQQALMSPFTSLDMDQSGPSFSSLREAEERLPPVASDDPSTSPGTSSRATSQPEQASSAPRVTPEELSRQQQPGGGDAAGGHGWDFDFGPVSQSKPPPAQQAANAGWDFGPMLAPGPSSMDRGQGTAASQPQRIPSPPPGRSSSEQEPAQPETASPAISGFPLAPRSMVPGWLRHRGDSPAERLPKRSMVAWEEPEPDQQLPR